MQQNISQMSSGTAVLMIDVRNTKREVKEEIDETRENADTSILKYSAYLRRRIGRCSEHHIICFTVTTTRVILHF